jgi:hypothetical protein
MVGEAGPSAEHHSRPPSPEEVEEALAEESDPDPQADELLVEQIQEAQDLAT